jgi:hypothetical protein
MTMLADSPFAPLGVLAIIAIVVLFRLFAGSMDGDRVGSYIAERGGRLLESNWAPFGKGWFGEKSDRIYEVKYIDRDGNLHEASCKTSMWTGVYFTEDRIVRYAERSPHEPVTEGLLAENERLRAEIERRNRSGRS